MDTEEKSTKVMDDYMKFVFEKVIEMYKDTVPDIMAQALNKKNLDDVKNITAQEVLEYFDLKLKHTYEKPEKDPKDPEKYKYDPKKHYDDGPIDAYYLTNIAKGIKEYTPKDNTLVVQTNDADVLKAQSIEELIALKENFSRDQGKTSVPISKLISDIDYVVHEIGHGFDRIIRANNPSYWYDSYMKDFMYSQDELKMQENIWDAEQFSISMEKIILKHLQEERTT